MQYVKLCNNIENAAGRYHCDCQNQSGQDNKYAERGFQFHKIPPCIARYTYILTYFYIAVNSF